MSTRRGLAASTRGLLLGALAALAAPAGADVPAAPTAGDAYGSLHLFFESLERIQDHYVEELTTERLLELAIDGIVSGLDEHSRLLEPEAFDAMRAKTRGSFSGVGVVVALRGDVPTVVSPIDGTPAGRAGVRAGERILAVDDVDTRDATLDRIVTLLRGPVGSAVRLTLERAGRTRVVELEREEIRLDSVTGPLDVHHGVAYVRISRFSERTATEFARALETVEASGVGALVLDLRDNPGGLLGQGVAVAEQFVPAGEAIVEVRSRARGESRFYRSGLTPKWNGRLAILVDEGTASAAEIVAGAVQDHGLGTVVGVPTFGKGSVQSIFAFEGGHALKLTTALYYTPSGRNVDRREGSDGGGIEPDVHVEPSDPDSLVAEAVASGLVTSFLASEADAFAAADFSLPLPADVLDRFLRFARNENAALDLDASDRRALEQAVRAEMALRDGGRAALLGVRLPADPQFRKAAELIEGSTPVIAARPGVPAAR